MNRGTDDSTDFFESRVSSYQKAGVSRSGTPVPYGTGAGVGGGKAGSGQAQGRVFTIDADF